MYGWRARIGVIDLASSTVLLPEYYRVVPEGVAVYTSRLVLPGCRATAEDLTAMVASPALEEAAALLVPLEPHIIVFACTTGSLIQGPGADGAISRRLERKTGVPATTTGTAVLRAFAALGLRRIALAGPYTDDLIALERTAFEAHGVRVVSARGLGIVDDREIGRQPPAVAYELGRAVDVPEADGVFLSCTNLRTLDVIAALEADLGKPVVTSNQATIWETLRRAGVRAAIPGFGRVLTV